jgi:F0F1-type ATP synthase membrane subunit b/b'
MIQSAKLRADEIIEQAHKEAAETQHEADKYILETLTNLELHLERLVAQVRNGISTLEYDMSPANQETENFDTLGQD